MRHLSRSIRNEFLSAVVALACLALASCGTTCVAGIFTNGTGIILVQNSNPPPACPFSAGMGTMNIAVGKSQICEICSASSRPQHIFVTLKSIQLHSVSSDAPDNPQWLEVAPQLVREPRQIDLAGDSIPEILVQSALIPAGTYNEVLLQFAEDKPSDLDALPAENSCGPKRPNCMVMADGHFEEFYFTSNGDSPELLVPAQYNGNSALAVVPDATVELRLRLQPQQAYTVSPLEGWRTYYVLAGNASVSR